MSIQNYWPERDKVIDCIRSEAEELTDQLLISVHQSMQLSKGLFGHIEGQGKSVTESDLLKHLKTVNRPIPLVGHAGSGKSHLVRWVHAKLRLDPEIQNNWHIVRIPKNASLRQVLNLLLDGLEGEEFDNARAKVHEVGSSLETEKVATLFVTFTRFALDEIVKKIKKGPRPDSKDKEKELRDKALIAKHLINYLKDDIIESHLTEKGMPVYNLANRLVSSQQSYQEVDESQYVIAEEHLEFNYDIDNLGKNARDAVNNLQLHTNPGRMLQCLDVLNEAINTSAKDIFSQLFQFNNGSFQDLFKDIRRSLKSKNKTLVVLVEDMAAISAIEDVLLDSLLEEDTYEGESDLCLLKSIVAVTDNYPGYIYRGATLVTRSNFEWKIRTEESVENYERVIDFCSRYINAARHGKQEIENLWKESKGFETLPVWGESLEGDELDTLGAFGESSIGIPLFPYNRASIIKLTKTYCMSSLGRIDFNPRKIINNILLPLLRDYHQDFVRGLFPSANFAPEVSTEGAMGVISEINRLGLNADEKARANKFAVIWGQGRTLGDLKYTVNNLQARVFSLPEIFGSGPVSDDTIGDPEVVKPKYCSECGEPTDSCTCQISHDTPDLELLKREQEIDDWFSHKQALPQETANELRKQLFDMLSNYRDIDWYGVDSTKQWKTTNQTSKAGGGSLFDAMVKNKQTYLIELPRTGANPVGSFLPFCKEEEISDSTDSIELKRTVLAILRYHYHNSGKQNNLRWDYNGGFEDFSYYTSFADKWVPNQTVKIISKARQKTHEFIAQQLAFANALGYPEVTSVKEALPILSKKSAHLRSELGCPINEELEMFREELLTLWDDMRLEWQRRLMTVNVAIDAGEFNVAYKQATKSKLDVLTSEQRRLFTNAYKNIQPSLVRISKGLEDYDLVDEVREGLSSMLQIYKDVRDLGFYPANGDVKSIETVSKYVKEIGESPDWPTVNDVKKLANPNVDAQTKYKLVNRLNGNSIERWERVLKDWEIISNYAFPKLSKINLDEGADKVDEIEAKIGIQFDEINGNLEQTITEEVCSEY